MLRHIILGALKQGGMKHGYAVMKEIRDRAGLRVSIGNVYRELKRLEAEGLVRSVTNPPGVDPRRVPFESTPVGVSVFDGWITSPPGNALPDYRDEFCLRAMFIEDSGREVARAVLDRWREELALHSRALERCQERALARRGGESGFAILPFFLARQLKHIATDLTFIEELRSAHDSWVGPSPQSSSRRPVSHGSRSHLRRQAAG
jgi:DNA-binding PadR family transcriptional regulator